MGAPVGADAEREVVPYLEAVEPVAGVRLACGRTADQRLGWLRRCIGVGGVLFVPLCEVVWRCEWIPACGVAVCLDLGEVGDGRCDNSVTVYGTFLEWC